MAPALTFQFCEVLVSGHILGPRQPLLRRDAHGGIGRAIACVTIPALQHFDKEPAGNRLTVDLEELPLVVAVVQDVQLLHGGQLIREIMLNYNL